MPAQVFLGDPVLDGIFKAVFALSAELHITRSRLRALEGLLVRKGAIAEDAIENWWPDEAQRDADMAELHRRVAEVFSACLPPAQKPERPA